MIVRKRNIVGVILPNRVMQCCYEEVKLYSENTGHIYNMSCILLFHIHSKHSNIPITVI